MTTHTRIKLALAIIGLILFAGGVRYDEPRLRLLAIAFVAAAWLMRFWRRKPEQPGE